MAVLEPLLERFKLVEVPHRLSLPTLASFRAALGLSSALFNARPEM
jgi:hypothetical protein